MGFGDLLMPDASDASLNDPSLNRMSAQEEIQSIFLSALF